MSTKTQAAEKQENVKMLPAVKPAETAKNDLQQKENEIKAMLNPTAEQRLKNLKNFQLLGQRFEYLKNKQDELNTFNISNDTTKEKLKLTNASGFVFELSNSNVIEEVIAVIGKHLDGKLAKTENEILEFSI